MRADIFLEGALPARGPLLRLEEPLSFWGGVDPATGRLSDPRSAHHGRSVAGTILMVPQPRGSSSSSAVILELVHRGLAPVALVLGEGDAIVGLGLLVAREMGLPAVPPLLLLPPAAQRQLCAGAATVIAPDGTVTQAQD